MSRSITLAFALGATLATVAIAAGCAIIGACPRVVPFRIDFDNLPLLHLIGTGEAHTLPPGTVVVHGVPPDACVAVFGPGPCREHGSTITGFTDAVAGPPPTNWQGEVAAPTSPQVRPVRP